MIGLGCVYLYDVVIDSKSGHILTKGPYSEMTEMNHTK